MASPHPIGITKGPGETAHEFTFISPDHEQAIKAGEFVYYEATVDGAARRVLGRVSGRRPVRPFPDGYLADPEVPPEAVAGMIGYEPQEPELFEVTVTILGYYEPALHDFVNPRLPPRTGWPIYIADEAMLASVLNRKRVGETGAVHVGSLLSRAADQVPVVLDGGALTSTHLAIIASTGAGKSYLAGVLLEELLGPHNRAAVLVVDPHGEYDTLVGMQGAEAFRGADGYEPEVRIIHPDDVKVRVSTLTMGDLRYLLPDLSEKMDYYLGRAYRRASRRAKGAAWTKADLKIALRSLAAPGQSLTDPHVDAELEQVDLSDNGNDEDATVAALIWRLESVLGDRGIFDDHLNLRLGDLCRPGRCTVLQVNEIPEREQRVVVATLLRRLFAARMRTERQLNREDDEDYLPYPVFVLIEEAHHFAPASGDVITSQILKQILTEGRKFGVAVGLISQRPGRLDADVLSQCMTQFILRIVNPIDQNRVAESVESVGRDLLSELPALSKGQAVIAGAAVNTPLLCRVRRRRTEHGAEDVDAPSRWLQWWLHGQDKGRERDLSFLAQPATRGRNKLYKD